MRELGAHRAEFKERGDRTPAENGRVVKMVRKNLSN
jgi:hypothetical protein